jgi:hypothetical protein
MRFCLNCGKPLPDAPIVFNLQDAGAQGQSGPSTNPYNKTAETQVGAGRGGFNQNQFSMVPPPAPRKSSKKIFIVVGGVLALFFLILVGVAGIIGYNLMKDTKVVNNPTPTPTLAPSASPSASVSPSATKSTSPTPRPSDSPKVSVNPDVKAKFKKVWVDYNVNEEGALGMKIHVKFEVNGLEAQDSYVVVYFQKADGTALPEGLGEYRSKDGRVAVLKGLKPCCPLTVYEDLEIFMPYDELNLTKGKYNLKMDVDVADGEENLLQHLTFHEFKYEKF